MQTSTRILGEFCRRVHGDESDPIGPNFTIDQLGHRELLIGWNGGMVSLAVLNDHAIQGPLGIIEFATSAVLSDELYELMCRHVTEGLKKRAMQTVCDRLEALGIAYSILDNGDLFFRRADGVPMYVRAFPDNQYDWTFKGSRNDDNHLEYRDPLKQSHAELFQAIDQFRRESEQC